VGSDSHRSRSHQRELRRKRKSDVHIIGDVEIVVEDVCVRATHQHQGLIVSHPLLASYETFAGFNLVRNVVGC
jgi:hypothetical protein